MSRDDDEVTLLLESIGEARMSFSPDVHAASPTSPRVVPGETSFTHPGQPDERAAMLGLGTHVEQDGQSGSDSASDSQSSSGFLSNTKQVPLPGLEHISIICDVCTREFIMSNIVTQFASESASPTSSMQPNLQDWMVQAPWQHFVKWVQEKMNSGGAHDPSKSFSYPDPLHLCLPMYSEMNEPAILLAQHVTVSSIDQDANKEESDTDGSDDETGSNYKLLCQVRFHSLSHVILPRQRFRRRKLPHSVKSLPLDVILETQEQKESAESSHKESGSVDPDAQSFGREG
jgi:hypothetical protein